MSIPSFIKSELVRTRVTLPRYVAVSLTGVMLGYAALWFFTDVVGLFYLVGGALGALLSMLNDFMLHHNWTFAHPRPPHDKFTRAARRFGKFALSKSLGFLLGLAALAFFTQVVGFPYLISNLFAIGASFTCNYIASSQWVWAKRNG